MVYILHTVVRDRVQIISIFSSFLLSPTTNDGGGACICFKLVVILECIGRDGVAAETKKEKKKGRYGTTNFHDSDSDATWTRRRYI